MTQPQPRRNPRDGSYYFELENPFPGGGTFSRIEIYQYDDYEWFWRDYMGHYMGPYPSRKIAEADARATYEQGWKLPSNYNPKLNPMSNLSPTTQAAWDSYNDVLERVGVFEDHGNALAAFLKVVMNSVVPEANYPVETLWEVGFVDRDAQLRRDLLAIATELETPNNNSQ